MENLHKILQGWYKGVQDWRGKILLAEAKGFPIDKGLKKRLDKIEKVIIPLGVRAKRDPSLRLSPSEALDLNKLLGRSGDVLSGVFRSHIKEHCRNCRIDMRKFEFVVAPPPAGTPMYHVTGSVMYQDINSREGEDIDETVETLTEILHDYKNAMSPASSKKVSTYKFERGIIYMEAELPSDADVAHQWIIDESGEYSELKLFINGQPLSRGLAMKAIEYFKKNHGWSR